MKLEQIEKNLLRAEQNGKARVWASPDEFLALLIDLCASANGAEHALKGINLELREINTTLKGIENQISRNYR